MGLDMYAFAIKEKQLKKFKETDVELKSNQKPEELFYWRKHHDLHGWFENLYFQKGGESESFNCCKVLVTKEDLDNLEKDVITNKLPHTEGFFFGDCPPDQESIANDLVFIAKARQAISEGKLVYYDSWW